MAGILFKNAVIINEGETFTGDLLTENQLIKKISPNAINPPRSTRIIDAAGKDLIPGVIDDQVHFREPGLSHKADLFTESRAAAAGGVTSFMEMPNTIPQTTNIKELDKKFQLAGKKTPVNYYFYL